jgi:hypothetical protein
VSEAAASVAEVETGTAAVAGSAALFEADPEAAVAVEAVPEAAAEVVLGAALKVLLRLKLHQRQELLMKQMELL